MSIYRFKIICTVRHALRTVNIKALLLHALRRTVVIKYMSLCEITLDNNVRIAGLYCMVRLCAIVMAILLSAYSGN